MGGPVLASLTSSGLYCWIFSQKHFDMQLSIAPELNRALVLPMLTLYVDVCVSLMCSYSISVGPADSAVAADELSVGGLVT